MWESQPLNFQKLTDFNDLVEAKEKTPLEVDQQQEDDESPYLDFGAGTEGLFIPVDLSNLTEEKNVDIKDPSPAKAQLKKSLFSEPAPGLSPKKLNFF